MSICKILYIQEHHLLLKKENCVKAWQIKGKTFIVETLSTPLDVKTTNISCHHNISAIYLSPYREGIEQGLEFMHYNGRVCNRHSILQITGTMVYR